MPQPTFTLAQIIQQLTTSWGGGDTNTEVWPGLTVTYSIGAGTPTNEAGYTPSEGGANWRSSSVAQLAAARLSFRLWDDVMAISLVESGGTNANITVNNSHVTSGDGTYSQSWWGSTTGTRNNLSANQIWISDTWTTFADSYQTLGLYGYETILHEIGHSLGLSHPGTYNAGGGGAITYLTDAVFNQDNRQYTVMSYFGGYSATGWTQDGTQAAWQYADTPMVYDIAAVQALYGADTTTRTGNNTYGFNSTFAVGDTERAVYDFSVNTTPILTIWDAGGTDLLDVSGSSAAQLVNLSPGTYSSVDGMTNNLGIAFGTTIENVYSGNGADTIYGNSVANTIVSYGGDDVLYGAAGNDYMDGGAATDMAYYVGNASEFYIGQSGIYRWVYDSTQSRGGTDTLINVENVAFSGSYNAAAYNLANYGSNGAYAWANVASATAYSASLTSLTNYIGARDFDGSSIVGYVVYDTAAYRLYNGTTGWVAANTWTWVSGATLANTYHYGSNITGSSDLFYVMAYSANGRYSNLTYLNVNDANAAPVAVSIFNSNNEVASGTAVALSTVFSASDANGDALTYYVQFTGAGSLQVNGVTYGAGTWVPVTLAQWAGATFTAGATAGTVSFLANDGTSNSNAVTVALGTGDLPATTATTGNVTVGSTVRGSVGSSGDHDYWRVTLAAGTYTFFLHGSPTNAGTLSDPLLGLLNSSGTSLATDDDGGVGLESRIQYTIVTAGTYYLDVGAFSTNTGTYSLEVLSGAVASPVAAGAPANIAAFGAADAGLLSAAAYDGNLGICA